MLAALRPVLFFVIFSGLWIALTDQVLGWLIRDTALLVRLSIAKGFVYILIVASVLFWMVHSALIRLERIRAERSHFESERASLKQQLEFLSAGINDIVLLLDDRGRLLWANDRAVAAYGYPLEELLERSVLDLRSEAGAVDFGMQIEIARREGSVRFSTTHVRKDGRSFPVEVSARHFLLEGKWVIQSVVRDVSERQEARKALEESERRFRVLFEQADIGIVECATDGRILRANPAFCKFLHSAELDLQRVNFREILDPGQLAADMNGLMELLGGEEGTYKTVKRYFRRDGSTAWARTSVVQVRDADGQPVNFVAVVQDIDAWRQADDSLKESARFLREAQRAGMVGIYSWEIQDDVWTSSPEMDEIFGIDASYPRTLETWTEIVAPDWRGRMSEYVKEVIETREHFDMDYLIQRPGDGQFRWVHGHGEVEFDDSGLPLRMRGVIQDIHERKQAEAEILRMNEELEQRVQERTMQLESANRELEAFSYSVSHDLRAPLRGIDGFSQALLEDFGPELPPEAHRYLERIRSGTARMGQLIDDLLRLSRISRGELDPLPVDLGAIAQKIIPDLRSHSPERRVDFIIQEPLFAEADPRLMQVLLENLLGNAWKFTSKCPTARIELGTCLIEGKTTFFVKDSGAGFDMAFAPKLFGAFQRLHSSEDFEGSGIGLAIVQRIVLRHGGEIWAEAVPGQGATFFFTL